MVSKPGMRAVYRRMQLTLHRTCRTPHGAAGLVQATHEWLVNNRRATSRLSRDARVYCHTTTTVHKLSTPRPPPLPPPVLC